MKIYKDKKFVMEGEQRNMKFSDMKHNEGLNKAIEDIFADEEG